MSRESHDSMAGVAIRSGAAMTDTSVPPRALEAWKEKPTTTKTEEKTYESSRVERHLPAPARRRGLRMVGLRVRWRCRSAMACERERVEAERIRLVLQGHNGQVTWLKRREIVE